MITKLTLAATLAATALATSALTLVAAPAARAAVEIPALDTVFLGAADNGTTVTVQRGERVIVVLAGGDDARVDWRWSVPRSVDSDALGDLRSGTIWGLTLGVFHADQAGTATITSEEHCVGHLGVLCSTLVRPWNVTVVVQ